MIQNGTRPVAAQLTEPLYALADQLEEIGASLDATQRLIALMSTLGTSQPAITTTVQTTGTLLALGSVLLLPLESGEVRYPRNITMQTNGVLGNYLEVRYAAGAYGYIGRDRHLLANMTDGDITSWTEVEGYQLDQAAVRLTRGYGFTSQEGLSWILPPSSTLNWQLDVALPAGSYTYLFLAAPSGYPAPTIRYVQAGTDTLRTNLPLRYSAVIPLQRSLSSVTVSLTQKQAYRTVIGHPYVCEVLTPTQEVYTPGDIRRIPGPYPALSTMGIQVAPDGTIRWPSLADQPTAYPERPSAEVEPLAAWRYVIALSDIAALTGTFSADGEAVVGPFSWTEPPSRIRLSADVYIPPEWESGDWVQFAVSFDRTHWYSMSVSGKEAPHTYALGSVLAEEEVPVLPDSGTTAWVRVRLSRPEADAARSPSVSNVRLIGEV